jgi:hypothetical protein
MASYALRYRIYCSEKGGRRSPVRVNLDIFYEYQICPV